MSDKQISKSAFDLIVEFEVSSKAAYERRYRSTEWPGHSSGVTIGIGYDCGYATPDRLRSDWKGRIPDAMIDKLVTACGITGPRASALSERLKPHVNVPWDAAIGVYSDVDMPRWAAKVRAALPNTSKLSPDSFGALVSLAYNRGPSFGTAGPRYSEMRAIRIHMANQNFAKIPAEFRSMKRLWPSSKGLRDRRDREAALFQRGLSAV